MDKLPIKLNELSPLIITLIEKIHILDAPQLPKQQKKKCTDEMLDIVENLRHYFATATGSLKIEGSTKIFTESIERAFSQFEWESNVAMNPYDFNKYCQNAKKLISSILKLLGTKGCGILIIETYVKLCLKTIKDMTEQSNEEGSSLDKKNFKLLNEGFLTTINLLKKYWHIAFLQNQKASIMLCLYQICKGLPYLLKMMEIKNKEIRKYVLNMLSRCLNRILEDIHCDGYLQAKDCGQEFITLMDYCLYKLNEILSENIDFANFIEKANSTSASLKSKIDELLCYVMSIAHVTSFENDYNAVVLSSQKVLKDFNDFKNDIEREDVPGIKLNAGSVGESLCNLERQVNTAVLRLVLEVFSGVNCPLKNIINKCRTDILKDNKTSEDLNVLISDFDSEMDKIMQIGLFAISCTSDLNRVLRIRSCLASLELLETELISCLTALYINCSAENKANFQYLIEFWLNEITELKMLIDSILDPAGFCEIVKVQIQSLVSSLRNETTSDVSLNNIKSTVKQIIRYSRKLSKTLKKSLEDEKEVKKETEERIMNFQLAVQECEAILELLDKKDDTNKRINQALKRCEFLLENLNELCSHLFDLVNNEDFDCNNTEKSVEDESVLNMKIPQENYYKLCNTTGIFTPTNSAMEMLTPYINKGILRSKKRNILYGTPTESEKESKEHSDATILEARRWDKTPKSQKRSRCCKTLNLNLELGNTIDLEITTVLENITQLSNTFSKSIRENFEKTDKLDNEKGSLTTQDVGCGAENCDTDVSIKPSYASRGCCANLIQEEKEKKEKEDEEEKEEKDKAEKADKTEEEEEESDEDEEKNFLGNQLRNRFQQSLMDLYKNESLIVSNDSDTNCELETPDRLNDLKLVEERINFLKQQVPGILP